MSCKALTFLQSSSCIRETLEHVDATIGSHDAGCVSVAIVPNGLSSGVCTSFFITGVKC